MYVYVHMETAFIKSVALKMLLVVLASVFLLGVSVSAQDDIGCFVPWKCINSNTVGLSFPPDANKCLRDCKANADCLYFTFESADGHTLCTLLTECTELDVTDSDEYISGNVNK